jgi:hypothetical protein
MQNVPKDQRPKFDNRGFFSGFVDIKNASRGYIPNFANPLQDAIGREQAAGLPINQIRVNQSPKLRNADNPMGLAVTNTRDEPTGAIPNFANGSQSEITLKMAGLSKGATAAKKVLGELNKKVNELNGEVSEGRITFDKANKEVAKFARGLVKNKGTGDKLANAAQGQVKASKEQGKAQRDLLGPIFALQAGLSFLSGATEGAGGAVKKYTNIISESLSGASSAAFAGVALNDFGKNIEGIGGKFVSKLGIWGAAIGGGIAIFKGVNEAINEYTGKNKAASLAMAALTDATKKLVFNFTNLSAVEQQNVKNEAKDIIEGTVTTRELDLPPVTGARVYNKKAYDDAVYTNQEKARLFDGGKDESGKTFKDAFTEGTKALLGLGISAEVVDAKLDELGIKAAKTGEGIFRVKLGQDALNEFIDFITTVNTRVRKDVDDFSKSLDDLSDKDFKALKKGFEEGGAGTIRGVDPLYNGPLPPPPTLIGSEIPRVQIENLFTLEENKRIEAQNKLKIDGARINTSLAKQEIQFAIDRAKADRSVLDQMDEKILKAELSKSLTEDEMISLKTEQSILQANFNLRGKTLDAVGAMAKESEELTFISEKDKKLRDLILATSKKTEISETERKDLIKQTKELLSESTGAIQLALKKSIEGLSIEEDKTKEIIEQLENLGKIKVVASQINQIRKASDLGAIGDIQSNTFNKNQTLEEAIKSRQLNAINRGRGAKTTLEQESLAKQAANDSVLNARAEAEKARNSLKGNEKKSIIDKIGGLGEGNVTPLLEARDLQGIGASAKSLVEMVGPLEALDMAISSLEGKDDTKRQELINFRKGLIESSTALDAQSESAIANAEANLKATGFFEKSSAKLIQDLATGLRRGANQGGIDAEMTIDPAERIKARINERSRKARAGALDAAKENGDFRKYRELVEEDQFSGKLVDASAQFAQNIGDAMTQAIVQGGNLGDILLGAASSFFSTLSQAFMTKAVNNVVSGIGSKFASGGKVTGGSGNRDDVPALLTGGEFVMKKSSVSKYGSSFMESLNAGSIPAMARGGLFTPGTYGQEEIKGSKDLLDFATQSSTTGAFDRFGSGSGSASVNLEPQSAALTMFGRRNSPAFQREQASKQKAFGLFSQKAEQDEQYREKKAMAKKALLGSIASLVVSAGFSSLTSKFGKAPLAEAVNPPNAIKVGSMSDLAVPGTLIPRNATGGAIPNAAGVDTVPSMLSGGEFVMNAAATQKIGRGSLNALNSGADGGSGDIVGKLDELISVSDNAGETVINITVNSDGSSDTQGDGDDQQKSLATKIKDVVRQVIDDEKRLGGSLRQVRA